MKMKRYIAADMRTALRAVREEQGSDAVILSTRQTSQGVEVCAAVDLELAAGQGTLAETAAFKQLERAALDELERSVAEAASQGLRTQETLSLRTSLGGGALDNNELAAPFTARGASSEPLAVDPSVGEELRSLRNLLEQQMAALAWNDFTRREPLKARALADLANLGLERSLALQIVAELPATLSDEQLQRMPYALLARRIRECASPMKRSGALALVGPAGAGKTTTLSKLAARYVLEQDAANLLLISTDDERLGSHEQLRSLGRVLGVRVETVSGVQELAERIEALPGRFVLIDTPGVAGRDTSSPAKYAALRARCTALEIMLILPASAQSGVIDAAVTQYTGAVAHCCALTRLDEAVSFGGVLSALARSQLPVAFVCDGPMIPDDLRPARAHQLVARGVELARQAQICADDELLARRYGADVYAAA
jgi:flagellar biosynthesis protein FlhF